MIEHVPECRAITCDRCGHRTTVSLGSGVVSPDGARVTVRRLKGGTFCDFPMDLCEACRKVVLPGLEALMKRPK